MSGQTLVGTSGYNYRHWGDGLFYPHKMSQKEWLEYYARNFRSVELNVTFYRLPQKKTFESWYKKTDREFVFAIKGSRYITHMKKLNDCKEPLTAFFQNAKGLKEKLGIILWQLPSSYHLNRKRIVDFCRLLREDKEAKKHRYAFEFRHESWFCPEVYDVLREYDISLCIAHSSRWICNETITANYIYLRFHGGGALYGSNYSDDELKEWAFKVKQWLNDGKDIYAYFNNDAQGYAVFNALEFRELLES